MDLFRNYLWSNQIDHENFLQVVWLNVYFYKMVKMINFILLWNRRFLWRSTHLQTTSICCIFNLVFFYYFCNLYRIRTIIFIYEIKMLTYNTKCSWFSQSLQMSTGRPQGRLEQVESPNLGHADQLYVVSVASLFTIRPRCEM